MTVQQALEILAEATEGVQASRKQHTLIVQALQVLQLAVQPQQQEESQDDER